MLHIGLLLFPRVQQLDLTAPYEVFASMRDTEVHLVSKSLDPVMTATRLTLLPSATYQTCPWLDVICIPGGFGVNALLRDEETLEFVRRQASQATYVTSVCTGSLVLGAAGLLRGKRATSHWNAKDMLAALGAIPTDGRVVRDGNVITGGGVTAGIDFALSVVEELQGALAAQSIQLALEYAPEPPFKAGSPLTAPLEVLQTVQEKTEAVRLERLALVSEAGAALGITSDQKAQAN